MMGTFLYLLRELLGRMRARSLLLFGLSVLLVLVFLGIFSSFFLLGPTQDPGGFRFAEGSEIMVFLSPQASADRIDAIYLDVREWEDVRRVNYSSAPPSEETEETSVGGSLLVSSASAADATLLGDRLASIDGVIDIEVQRESSSTSVTLSMPARLGLLGGLALTAFGSLLVARIAFRDLLDEFAAELSVMRVSGAPERSIHVPILALGLLVGLLACLLLVVAMYVAHVSAVTHHPAGGLSAAAGLLQSDRILVASLLSLLLALIMGGLAGLLGVSLALPRSAPR